MAARGLVVHEEERLVLLDRTAQGPAELLEVEGRLLGARVLEVAAGVERLVAKEVEGAAAHRVGSGLEGRVDDGPAGASELGRVVAGLDLELLDGVHVRVERGLAAVVAVVVDAVKEVVVLAPARPVHHEGRVHVAVAPLGGADDAARQGGELDVVPAVQGQIHDLPRVDHLAEAGRLGLDEGSVAGDDDGFLDVTRHQLEVEAQAVLDPHHDAFARLLLEADELDAYRVGPDPERRCHVVPRGVGDQRHDGVRRGLAHAHACAGHDRPALVAHGAEDGARVDLGLGRSRQERDQDEDELNSEPQHIHSFSSNRKHSQFNAI